MQNWNDELGPVDGVALVAAIIFVAWVCVPIISGFLLTRMNNNLCGIVIGLTYELD